MSNFKVFGLLLVSVLFSQNAMARNDFEGIWANSKGETFQVLQFEKTMISATDQKNKIGYSVPLNGDEETSVPALFMAKLRSRGVGFHTVNTITYKAALTETNAGSSLAIKFSATGYVPELVYQNTVVTECVEDYENNIPRKCKEATYASEKEVPAVKQGFSGGYAYSGGKSYYYTEGRKYTSITIVPIYKEIKHTAELSFNGTASVPKKKAIEVNCEGFIKNRRMMVNVSGVKLLKFGASADKSIKQIVADFLLQYVAQPALSKLSFSDTLEEKPAVTELVDVDECVKAEVERDVKRNETKVSAVPNNSALGVRLN